MLIISLVCGIIPSSEVRIMKIAVLTIRETKFAAVNNGSNEKSLEKSSLLVFVLYQWLGKNCRNGCSSCLTSQPAVTSGGGFTICGVDINSPFVHASKMALPPVLPTDEPFANEKNIDKAKEWLRKEGWRKRVWWVRRWLESMRRLKEHFKKVFRKRCASKIVYIAIVIRKDLHERFFKNIGANKGSPEKPAYSRSSKSPVKVCALWFAPAVPLCLRSPTMSSCLPL
jgi:hypothetical protein